MPLIVDAVESVEVAKKISSADDRVAFVATENTHCDMLSEEY